MRAFSLVCGLLVVLALTSSGDTYSPYDRRASSNYASSASYSSSSGSSSSTSTRCCQMNSWAYGHMDEVRQFANRLRQEYNNMSQGSSTGYSAAYGTPWNENILGLTGKTASELDALNRRLGEQLVTDMRKGLLTYNTIAQPNFFETKAAEALESYVNADSADYGQQQQQIVDFGHFQPIDLSTYDEVKNYAYPAEVKMIDGKTYLVHKNCTEASKTVPAGVGSYGSPLISMMKRNRTVIATNTGNLPPYGGSYSSSGSLVSGSSAANAYPAVYHTSPGVSSTTTITRKKTIYDWMNQNMEPTVVGYSPVVNVNSEWSSNMDSYKPPVHIPISAAGPNADVELYRPGYGPGSTVTVHRYNKSVITNPDGSNTVSGSELNRKWVDGKLVYDSQRPFGDWSVPRDTAWKREERERFFWFLSQGDTSPAKLEEWQRQQEERLLSVASRYHTPLAEIHDWHRQELDRYRALLRQYQAQSTNDVMEWQRLERGRLDWLIHQNSVTREELERWQRENNDRLAQLARQYSISLDELKTWQVDELNRLYVYFNDQNRSMISRPDSRSLQVNSEQERLDELIRQHSAVIAQLHNSIKTDQQKLSEISTSYRVNVQDLEKRLKDEMERLAGLIQEQRNEMNRVTEWQRSERERLENAVKQHRGTVGDLEAQMARDRSYIQSLANKYHVSIEELQKWQSAELDRLKTEGQTRLDLDFQEWQKREREHLKSIIQKNDLTIEEFQTKIMSDRARLEDLARTYKIQVSEVEEWIRNEIKTFKEQGLLKEVQKELALWQQKERDRLLAIVQQNELTVEELEKRIKNDQSHLTLLANTYHVKVDEIEDWLKAELQRLQSEGLVKADDLKDWQRAERDEIMQIVRQNKLTIDEFEKKLLADRARLQDLSSTYNVQTSEIESWIKKEGERLQNLGLLQMQEQLSNWQKIERERLLNLINQNNLSIDELEEKIKKDQVHLYSLAGQHQVRVEEIEEWIKKEIQRLKQEGLIEMGKLKDWQTEWRGNLTNMVKDRDFTVEEFHKWLLEDRSRLQSLAMQHNVQIEEIEQWVRNEEQRFVSMGLLKPNEKLTNWQEVERRYLERIAQQQYHSTEQLEQRLRQDRELLEKLARDYSVQVEEIEKWMKKELGRLKDEGQLQIDNLTSWQLAERERLEQLTKENQNWSVEEFEAQLRKDRDHMQTLAFQYHTSVEEIEKWIQSEVDRLRQQGHLDIQNLTAWQKAEQQRILNLLKQQSSITSEEFEQKIQQDRRFLLDLANQYHVSVAEVEEYVKSVINDLRNKGKFEVENLQSWQIVERDYIKQLIAQSGNTLSTAEYEQKLLNDRVHLQQLAEHYRISVEQIENFMLQELHRLRNNSENHIKQLSAWQVQEVERLKDLVHKNSHLNYVEFEVELMKERSRLQDLAKQYSLSVEEIERWLRQQLVNLKTTGQVQVESLTQWQEGEQKRLIDMLLQQQKDISFEEFEAQLRRDRSRLQQLAQQYKVTVEQIETWMRDELQRLKNSGLLQIEQLTYWQKIERDRLQDWLKQQHGSATYDEFNAFIKRDKDRLQRIAADYQVTVEEVESWVQQEAARLQILGMIQRPQNYVYHDEYQRTWGTSGNTNQHVYVDNNRADDMWKVHTRAHLQAIAQVRSMNLQDFERYLAEERMRWEQFARQYNITVEDIEVWLRQAAQELVQQGLIHGQTTEEEWQSHEKLHIESLINEKLRKQQQWSIEELERQLKYDREHLQQLAAQYHVTVELIESWYRQELQNLLQQRKIITEHLTDWQQREKDRLYSLVTRQPGRSLQIFEMQLLEDKSTLNHLADVYHVAIEELELFIRNELKRLTNLGLIHDSQTVNSNHWQQVERERLRAIAAEITITEEELLEFIAGDHGYQKQLSNSYRVPLDKLAPFQRIEVGVMQREGLFDNTKLLTLEHWQKRERDRLYSLIKNQNFSLKNLKDWQRQDMFLSELAIKYGISVQALKDWQLQEYERLMQLAEHYHMSLNELQDFRDKELRYISFVMHKKTSSESERVSMSANEARRSEVLQRQTGLGGAELLAWRRKLYLLCQGLIPMDFGGYGGHESGVGSTNRTAIPQQIISKDRGDQPPNVHEENIDEDEPGLAGQGQVYVPPIPSANIRQTTRRPNSQYAGIPVPAGGGGEIQSGYRYSKKEYKFTVPVAADAAVQPGQSQFNGMESHSLTMNDQPQQQQQENVEDLGQQQQVDSEWNGHLTAQDRGQQQMQVEDLSGIGFGGSSSSASSSSTSSHGHYTSSGSSRQVEDLGQQQMPVEDLSGTGYGRSSASSSSHGSYTSSSGGSRHIPDDLGQQQQVELGEYKQHELDSQQHVQVEDLTGTFTTRTQPSEKQINAAAAETQQVEVKAEPESSGFWGKLKQKTTNIFG